MKTLALTSDAGSHCVALEFTEFELTTLVALDEQGVTALGVQTEESGETDLVKQRMKAVAVEFGKVLAHFELLAANDEPL